MTFSSEKSRELAMSVQAMMVAFKEVDESCAHLVDHMGVRELHLVSHVGDHDQVSMSSIAQFLHIPMSTATSIVDKMVENGYLKRGFSPRDRRKVLILLDDDGQSVYIAYSQRCGLKWPIG